MENRYIDIIIKIIASRAKEYSINNSLSPAYFINLLTEIKDSIITVIKVYGYPEIDEVTLKNYYETAKNQYLSVSPIDIDPSSSLTKEGFRTWLTTERKEEMKDSWNYSNRYFTLLEKSGRSEKVVEETKKASLEILERMGDPKSREEFYVKGLVVGSVQAGKTQNFNAVINRAIDSGYKLIIVLAGLMEDLRNQTQVRINSDVVGEGEDIDTGKIKDVGVGEIRKFGSQGDESVVQIISVTSAKSDFKKTLLDADFSLNHTNILVCKNNVSVLRNLIVWLHDYLQENKEQHNIPLLILDDEADNASLNNEGKKGREYASKTNGHIRALLALFKRKTYLGYTATPFANILADRNDAPENDWIVKYKLRGQAEEKALQRVDNLFPDDFIVLLNPPTNYIGAKQLFETTKPIDNKAELKIPLVEIVDDNIENFPHRVYFDPNIGELTGVEKIGSQNEWDEKFGRFGSYLNFADYKEYRKQTRSSRPGDDFPRQLPDSIKESILCFILSIAIRESRKPALVNSSMFNPHNSMLIHISRYTLWQNRLKDLIDVYVRDLQSSLQLDDPTNPNSIFAIFERVWFKYYSQIIEHIFDYLPKGYDDEFLKPISFETIKNSFLTDAIKGIEVKAINSTTGDKLVYPKNTPKKYIAIGGNRLSRGFTLEGLSINYFVRSTDYSDALLQMGRWFGYRPGYLDCCKLFITSDSMEKYDLVTRTIEELEIEFRKMEEKDRRPSEFILRVKKHPGTLKITRPAILRDTLEVNWSYQDSLEQSTNFDIRKKKIKAVWEQFRNNIAGKFKFESKKKADGTDAGFLLAQTDISGVLELLRQENNFGSDTCDSVIKFLERCQKVDKLRNWTIAIKTTGRAKENEGKGVLKEAESNLRIDVTMTVRRGPGKEESVKYFREKFIHSKIFGASGKSANLISAGLDMAIVLTDTQIKSAEKEFVDNRKRYYAEKYPEWTEEQVSKKAKEVNIPERVYREKMTDQEGLLVIYILDSYYVFLQEQGKEDAELRTLTENEGIDLNIPLIGYAIGFPPIDPDPGGVYVHGNYGFEEDEEEREFNETDSELPEDINEI